ncbi:ABC-three component system middle component 5 [Paracoccus sediminilitoris]|uniref:ABC-three component system middle component 5 n=1 Tax=Paracoccus sediminilitoris TaxID=2202419 RepID=UPI0011B93F8B|nr:ABC-three component system middle component 5 [Paracoccus sediminilitoris]
MLVYHPAFDIYHGFFRAVLLLENTPTKSMPADTLRIVDLYFMFPYLLHHLDFPRGAGSKGRKLAGDRSKFNTLPSPKLFLEQTKGLHMLVVAGLEGHGFISSEALKVAVVQRTEKSVPLEIIKSATAKDIELASYLGNSIATIPIFGKRGLKERSKLMEFRYDPA